MFFLNTRAGEPHVFGPQQSEPEPLKKIPGDGAAGKKLWLLCLYLFTIGLGWTSTTSTCCGTGWPAILQQPSEEVYRRWQRLSGLGESAATSTTPIVSAPTFLGKPAFRRQKDVKKYFQPKCLILANNINKSYYLYVVLILQDIMAYSSYL